MRVCLGSMETNKESVTRLDYCQYLLISQINYMLTNFADHTDKFSHDAINRYLAGEKNYPPPGMGERERTGGANCRRVFGV